MQAKEQKFRTSLLVCDTGNKVLQELFTVHLSKNHGSIAINAFLDQNQHEIFHLYSDSQCCQCSNSPYRHNRMPLRRHQMELIFDEHNKKSCHKTQRRPVTFCCSIAKPTLRINDFDITLLNTVLINLCHDLFWEDCLMHQSLAEFLEKNKHVIYHLWNPQGRCCRCTSPNSKNSSMIDSNQWYSLFDGRQSTNGCSIGDACSYTPKITLTSQNIDDTLSSVLHMNFSDLRKDINRIVILRNLISHKPSGNQVPPVKFSDCERPILEIAKHIGAEYETLIRKEIADLKSCKLDEDHYNKLMATLEEQNDKQEQIVNILTIHEKNQILRENERSNHDRENHEEQMKMLGVILATIKDKKKVESLVFNNVHLNKPEDHLQDHQQQQNASDINQAVGGSSLSWFRAIPFRLYSWFQETTDSSTEEFIAKRYGDPSDTFRCGLCELLFNDLLEFFAHKKRHKAEEKMAVKTRFTTTGADTKWEDASYNYSHTNRESLNVDGCEVIEEHTGSLIFLTKISTAMFRTKEVFLDVMQIFINNLLQKCPLENDDVTVLEIKIHIKDDFESDDCFKCGLCDESYNNLAAFILHKESTVHKAKKEQNAKQPGINKKEPNIADNGKEVSLVGESPFKHVTHDNTELPLHRENVSRMDVASGIVDSLVTLPYEEPDIAETEKEVSLVGESHFKQMTLDNPELLLHREQISGMDVASGTVKSSVTLHYEKQIRTDQLNFVRMAMISLDIFRDVLYDLLKLSSSIVPHRSTCDVTSLYAAHKNLNKFAPTLYWGRGRHVEDVLPVHKAIGDDIERIRLIRNEIANSESYLLPTVRCTQLLAITADILNRFDVHFKPSKAYLDRLEEIRQMTYTSIDLKRVQEQLPKKHIRTDQLNFVRMGMISLDIFRDVLYDLLKLRTSIVPHRSTCDVTSLYAAHKNLNHFAPSLYWGRSGPHVEDVLSVHKAIGDDIERIRLIRNEIAHSESFLLPTVRYTQLLAITADILNRFDVFIEPSKAYSDRLEEIRQKMTYTSKELKRVQEQLLKVELI